MKALGMIELYGYLPAVEALDAALKAANVTLVDTVCVKGGLVTVLVEGDVGAVKAAMDASAAAAQRVGTVISVHVIPRPAEEVRKMLDHDRQHPGPGRGPEGVSAPEESSQKPETVQQTETIRQERITEEKEQTSSIEESEVAPVAETAEDREETENHVPAGHEVPEEITEELLQGMSVAALRRLARTLKITSMSRQEIKFAKKQELIRAILEFSEKK